MAEVRYGPTVRVDKSCDNCPACLSKHYVVQSDSGYKVSCAHPTLNGSRLIGDTTWKTPDWCPAENTLAEARRDRDSARSILTEVSVAAGGARTFDASTLPSVVSQLMADLDEARRDREAALELLAEADASESSGLDASVYRRLLAENGALLRESNLSRTALAALRKAVLAWWEHDNPDLLWSDVFGSWSFDDVRASVEGA